MKIYGLKNCDTCRKALKELDAAGIVYDYIDVRADGVPIAALERWLQQLGVDKVVNKRSTTWRGLSDDQKAKVEAGEGVSSLLLETPTLIKRPVIEHRSEIMTGWTPDVKRSIGL